MGSGRALCGAATATSGAANTLDVAGQRRAGGLSAVAARCARVRLVESGLYNNASEVVRESLRLLKEHDEVGVRWREQIERGWLDAPAGRVVDGPKAMRDARTRLKKVARKRV